MAEPELYAAYCNISYIKKYTYKIGQSDLHHD